MVRKNLVLATDSYKLTHWNQYPKNTEAVYSYFESREGATWPYTVFFGLQAILQDLAGSVVSAADVIEAEDLAEIHFGRKDVFNKNGWARLVVKHGGKLPLRIKAVPEGSVIPTGNVLMTVENTDPEFYWLTNAVESLLTHVWYPCTVATLSRTTKETINKYLNATAESTDGLPFMLHDFGYRGASSHESAAIGGAAHLVNFMGTDTLPAMLLARDVYGADLKSLAFSVPATEHSVMTALGQNCELLMVDQVLDQNPSGIVSVVADSYNIYNFVKALGSSFKKDILERDGTFVVRPDSVTSTHPYPADLTCWILNQLWEDFGGTTNSKGFKVLDSHVKVLWGDGIDPHGIENILGKAQLEKFSAENMVFGMGGGLLQKVNRDTQRFAFKSSAQKRDGEWHDVWKDPVDSTKKSKRGRLALVQMQDGTCDTIRDRDPNRPYERDVLQTVFENGKITRTYTFDEIRQRAEL